MRVSINEVQTSVLKAARARQLPEGLCEDLSRASAWLCANRIDGIAPALGALQGWDRRSAPTPIFRRDHCILAPAALARVGPSAFDLLLAGRASAVVVGHIDEPTLLLGYAGIACAHTSAPLQLKSACGREVVISREGFEFTERGPGTLSSQEVRIAFGPAHLAANRALPTSFGFEVVDTTWRALQELAALTYVPASALSRDRGAGPDGIDDEQG